MRVMRVTLILGVVILNVVKNSLEVDHIPHVDYAYSARNSFAILSMTAYASMSVETYGLQKYNPHGIDAYHALIRPHCNTPLSYIFYLRAIDYP